MAKAMKSFCLLLITIAVVAGMAGMGEAQPDDPCLDNDCEVDGDCLVGYTCCEVAEDACGPGMGYCCNPCDYPCDTTADCKAGWECMGLETVPLPCNGMGYCWPKKTVPDPEPTPDPMPEECSDPTFHCSDHAACGGEGFICYGFEINLCGPGLGYCTQG